MEQIKIDVVKQWLINKKEFSPLEVIEELEKENEQLREKLKKISDYLANEIPHELMNEATNKIWKLV